MKKKVNAATAGIQGSGWGWLVSNSCGLEVVFYGVDCSIAYVGVQQVKQEARGGHNREPRPLTL